MPEIATQWRTGFLVFDSGECAYNWRPRRGIGAETGVWTPDDREQWIGARPAQIRVDWLLILVAILVCFPARGYAEPESEPAPPEAKFLGEAICLGCHSVEAEHWATTVHGRALNHEGRGSGPARSCEACHGPGSAHLTDPNDSSAIVSFTRESGTSVEQMNEMCLSCHRSGPLLHWQGSTHEWQDLACSDCHNPMAQTSARGLLRESRVSDTCFGCHPQQRAEFRKRSHMPLLEGKMSCVDCHAPHGSATDPLLRGDSVNQVCYTCHAEKRGPFIWEHAPVREDCLNCHHPHGSNHESLLVTARPFLCQQCHSQLDDLSIGHPTALATRGQLGVDERLSNRSCTNCHSQIHGSNHPSGARFHR